MDELVQASERAVLAALAQVGRGATELLSWLSAEDFVDDRRRRLFSALRLGPISASRRGLADPLLWESMALEQARVAPEAVPAHARLVLAASVRRSTAGLGVVLQAGALSASRSGDPAVADSAVRLVTDLVEAHRKRWAMACGREESAPVDFRWPWEALVSADRFVGRFVRHEQVVVEEWEARFVSALIARPQRAACWTSVMGPGSISSPQWRAAFGAVGRLVSTGQAVDAITVGWEVHRRSRVDGAGPGFEVLRRWVDAGAGDDPDHWGRRVAGLRLCRAGDGAARSLHEAAANPGVEVEDLLDMAATLAGAIERAAVLVELPAAVRRRAPIAVVGVVRGPDAAGACG